MLTMWSHSLNILCLLVLILFCCQGCDKAEQKGASTKYNVKVIQVNAQRVALSVELSGRVSAFKTAEVRPQVSGILQKQLFTEGALVQAGQSLYKIDPATYAADVASAKAALAKAQAGLNQAALRRSRRHGLLASKAVSQQAVEDADAEYLQAKADVEVCQANLRSAEIRLRYTDVLAPITGRIGRSLMTQGSLVTANQEQALAIIHQLDPVYVDMPRQSDALFKLKQRYAKGELKVTTPKEASVHLLIGDNYHYPLPGKLQFADISVDQSTGMVLLRALFPNPEQVLLAGLYVRAIVDEGIDEEALCVPEKAVQRNARGQASIFIVTKDHKAQLRYIQTAERIGKNIVVAQGLKAGELVVVDGFQRLKDGVDIKITNR